VRRSSARRSDVGMSRGSALRIALRIPVRSVAAILNSRALMEIIRFGLCGMVHITFHYVVCIKIITIQRRTVTLITHYRQIRTRSPAR